MSFTMSVHPSVYILPIRLSACVRAAPTKHFSMKFGIGDFYKKSVMEFQIWLRSGKNIGHFAEDLNAFYCWLRHKFAIQSFPCKTHYCYIADSDMYLNNTHRTHCYLSIATFITQTHYIVTLRYTYTNSIFVWALGKFRLWPPDGLRGVRGERLDSRLYIVVRRRPYWPRGPRCGSAAARLLGLRVRIPP